MFELNKKDKYNICIVGATGLVGQTFLKVLEEYDFPIDKLRLLASSRSKGKKILFKNQEYTVEELTKESFIGMDIALFSAGGAISKEYCEIVKEYCLVIDNSSVFRMSKYPLVVVEVNPFDICTKGIIANPNCTTIQSIVPIKAIDDMYEVTRINYTSYQAVSGSGMKGINDLRRTLNNETNEFYPYDISKTPIPHIDSFLDNGYTKEEMKMVNETRKILHKPNLPISATCVRVPIENCHAVSISLELKKGFELDEVRNILSMYPGIKVVDDFRNNIYPVTMMANGNDYIYVGRIRRDLSVKNGLLLYVVGDNIRKGAASNAVQIAKYLIERVI